VSDQKNGAPKNGAAKNGAPKMTDDTNVVEEAIDTDATAGRRGRYGIVSAAVAIIFGLFFAYDLFEAISNFVLVIAGINHTNQISKDLGLNQSAAIPWAVLIPDLLIAPVVYAIAFVIGRRRGLLARAAIFLIALASAAALILSLEEGFSKFFS
jgi:hypothetical protein